MKVRNVLREDPLKREINTKVKKRKMIKTNEILTEQVEIVIKEKKEKKIIKRNKKRQKKKRKKQEIRKKT